MESMDVGKRPQLLLRQKFLAVACGVLAIISVALSYQLYSLRSSFSNWRELSELKSFSSPLSAAASIPPSTTLNTPTTLASPTPSTPAPPLDFFRNFIGRERCAFGSPDLHLPSANADLCPNRTALLDSMTDGGRRGFEAPYMPRDCDLRFYTTAEICAILSRFEDVVFLGDSMVRHLIGAFLMLLRENYEYGAQTQWTDRDKVLQNCACDSQSYLFRCHATEIRDLDQVLQNDPSSIRCPSGTHPRLSFVSVNAFPIEPSDLEKIKNLLSPTRPAKPYAFVYGHGLWNELNLKATDLWLNELQSTILSAAPYLNETSDTMPFWPRVFLSPNAAGINKADSYMSTQGNVALERFERAARVSVPLHGPEFFGTWNMSIQSSIPDGTHAGLRTNLLKAMAVINWLDLL